MKKDIIRVQIIILKYSQKTLRIDSNINSQCQYLFPHTSSKESDAPINNSTGIN